MTVKKKSVSKIEDDLSSSSDLTESFSWRDKCNFPDLDYSLLFDVLVALIPGIQEVSSDKRGLITKKISSKEINF